MFNFISRMFVLVVVVVVVVVKEAHKYRTKEVRYITLFYLPSWNS